MKQFVDAFKPPTGIRVKPNRSSEGRAHGKLVYETCRSLESAGIPSNQLVARRGRFWTKGQNGELTLLGKIVEGKVEWTLDAPMEVMQKVG